MTKRYDWANKVDPDTGARTRFCTRCEAFLPLAKFYACHVKLGHLACKTHANARNKPHHKKFDQKRRGEPRSVERLRYNTNQWLRRLHRSTETWTDADVQRALQQHSVDLATETRSVLLRPRDPTRALTVDNAVVRFRKFRSGATCKSTSEEYIHRELN